jgi:triacylglycerol lipase
MTVPRLRAPIVLVHGLLGFGQLRLCGWTIASYFSGIPEHLATAGNRVLVAHVSPTEGVAERAAQLKTFLDQESAADPVHILAHSMGGLDSRYLISRLGMGERVLSLTTIGTPHRGSPFADWGIRRIGRVVQPILQWLDIPIRAFHDLTIENCRQFNEAVPDDPGVRYFSVAGRHNGDWSRPEWQLPFRIVTEAEGANDGIVSVASAAYGEGCEIWEGDHLSLVNWPDPVAQLRGLWRDRQPDYSRIVQRLADEGF